MHHVRAPTRLIALVALASALIPVQAADWPEWRGTGRTGVWNEPGAIARFPAPVLEPTWKVAIHGGYAGPAVATGRVFVSDFIAGEGTKGTERVLALDERTGKELWVRSWPADYAGTQPTWATGPRATPTVEGDSVWILGAAGRLSCLDVATGAVRWEKEFVRDFRAKAPAWGFSGAPLVDGTRLIAIVGGADGAAVVAFDKRTGAEVWRALSAEDPGYNAPMIIDAGGRRQLVIWLPQALYALDPANGRQLWQQPFAVNMGMTVASPAFSDGRLIVSSFFNGSLMMELAAGAPTARRLWQGTSESEVDTDGLHALISTPILAGDTLFGICSYGQLRALDAKTGRRLWESGDLTKEKARWSTAFFVKRGERWIANNDRGELVLFELSRERYRELSRAKLIEPTSPGGGRREFEAVHWSHPAYANGHVVVRNDREIRRVALPVEVAAAELAR